MKILVTGGAGFIASNIVDRLVTEGHEVAVVDNLSTGSMKNLNSDAMFFKGDIRDFSFLKEVFAEFRPDIVNHHAAQMDVRVSTREPRLDAEINILGSINLILLSVQYTIQKFVYISTGGAVYGEPLYLPVREDHPINPLSQYGISKHTVEHYLYLYSLNYNLQYAVLRYPNVYGPRQNPHGEAGVIAIFGSKMLMGEQPVIFGDGQQTRDYVYISDIVEANMKAMFQKALGIYNIGSGIGTSVLQLHKIISYILKQNRQPIFGERRIGEIQNICLDANRANEDLEWSPKISIQEGIELTMHWIKEQMK
ncbi:NAD-dependent epimerase/dehydratase family protein [Cohnella caldifontis]|uniref:NAD-dependent epimerase/dehydratase family protein n=1 Tax=Cohnella caldifontis TaxID=3027471 RepID=UPI0023EBD0F5|nr:NAD-dependent epimerase/dehydratase family protein [Cohnella sp. YIM B05605]